MNMLDHLRANDLEDLLEDSGYFGFLFQDAKFIGTGGGKYAAVYEVTSEDESGLVETVTSTVFITVQPNGDLQARLLQLDNSY